MFQARGNCEDQFDLGYRCVPYYNCDECNRIITDGRGLFDPRTTATRCETNDDHEFLTTSICPKIVQVCCLHPNSSLPGNTEINLNFESHCFISKNCQSLEQQLLLLVEMESKSATYKT